jgi:hypothetical protein
MLPRNLCELLLRDLASLLATSRNLNQSLQSLRPKCEFSADLTVIIDSMVRILEAGAARLHPCLTDTADAPAIEPDQSVDDVVTDVFARLPGVTPGIFAAEVAVNLRLLARHLELKTRLAAESALLVGQDVLCRILMLSATEWRRCDRLLRTVTVRARALAYVADLDDAGCATA